MPLWVKVMLLAMGLLFIGVGVLVGVFGTRREQARVAMLEGLRPLSAIGFEDQRDGAPVLLEGVISERNPVVLRNVVAWEREELDVTTDSDGDRDETWRSDGRETPPLLIDADGRVPINNQGYSIERAHETWYDEATVGFNDRPRDGTLRYYGLVVGGRVTVYGTVAAGAEGNELVAQTVFGGTHAEYMTSQRESVAFMPIFGGIFGVCGLILCAIPIVFWRRR